MKFIYNNIYIKYDNKYALFDYINNIQVTEFIYDGITYDKLESIANSKYGLYANTSKYNQVLDIFDNQSNNIKRYNYCTKIESSDKLLCSEHIAGNLSNEDIDKVIDIVLTQYPTLNNDRLFTIKTAIETVGLPYFWGGGHNSLDNTIYTATEAWGIKNCTVAGRGFKNQKGGYSYPCGLDCSGFVRWVYYVTTGTDLMGKGVSVIGGRNNHPDFSTINEDELLPGDIIMDKDHVIIYLYKDESGKPISVHAAFDNLKVEISNYKKGNEYFRLNIWK